ncbi:hypothetical protein ACE02H_18475 [Shewanella mangrovisoli]|uniref:hypothetical protein n=1 Tax=Shewanella mangrovisoli TaxID=2864211 RepID=UPI0035B7BF0D
MNLNRYWFGGVVIIPYAYMMFLKPWIDGRGDWQYVQAVWMDWQSLNTGVFALIASFTALYVTSYRQRQEDEKNKRLAKALLVNIAENVYEFCLLNASILLNARESGDEDKGYSTDQYASKASRELLEDLRFSLKHLDDKNTDLLSDLISQITNATFKINQLYRPNKYAKKSLAKTWPEDIDHAFKELGYLLTIVDKLFQFVRGEIDILTMPIPNEHEKISALRDLAGMHSIAGEMLRRRIKNEEISSKMKQYLDEIKVLEGTKPKF